MPHYKSITMWTRCNPLQQGFSSNFHQLLFSILRQNGTRFAAKWNAFCGKTERVLRQNASAKVLALGNKNEKNVFLFCIFLAYSYLCKFKD